MSTPKRKRCKYPHFVAVRVADELYEKINNGAIAAGVSPSEYLRQIIKKGHLIVKREAVIEVPLIKKLIAEYGKIGSNLNQIAHYFNAGGPFTPEIEKQLTENLSLLYSLKYDVERMGGEFRSYSEAYRSQEQ